MTRGLSVLSVHRIDPRNLGDMHSAPTQYFGAFEGARAVDVFEPITESDIRQSELIIVGGGGVLGHCDAQLADLLRAVNVAAPSPPIVMWGGGNGTAAVAPEYLRRFDLVGVRDYQLASGTRQWVPCASCLSPAFDVISDEVPTVDVAIYDAHQNPVERYFKTDKSIPRFVNDGNSVRLIDALRFISSARAIVTRSYHGAYWASLLGKDVIVPGPPARKYLGLREQPHYVTGMHEARVVADSAAGTPKWLDEARHLNREFYQRVEKLRATSTLG